ncbi:PilW family protein [Undibacterium sp. Di27W]|uniref:PilW family protein n=1 Tax=Undibacterium sp. Di27W TaxID=3413036 RepID=UPI003BEF8E38
MKNLNIKYAHGRSLIELMVAMVIGFIILLAVGSLYVTNTQTYRVTDSKALLEEEGRLALNLMAFHVRMIGYGELQSASTSTKGGKGGSTNFSGIGIKGCTGGFTSPTASQVSCTGGATPDAFSVGYVVESVNSNTGSSAGVSGPADCMGRPVLSSPANVENRFYIATNASTGRNELYCVGNGGVAPGADFMAGQPIADNVVSMSVTYGYDSDGNQSVDGFYTAASLESLAAPTTLPVYAIGTPGQPSPWDAVISAKICVVVTSTNTNVTTAKQTYIDCQGNTVTATDNKLYSAFSTVVALRGRVQGKTS